MTMEKFLLRLAWGIILVTTFALFSVLIGAVVMLCLAQPWIAVFGVVVGAIGWAVLYLEDH